MFYLPREKGFTLAELLVVVLIIALLSTIAILFFSSQIDNAKDKVADSNLRTALITIRTEYSKEGGSYTKGPLATGTTLQEQAENFTVGAIKKNTSLDAVLSNTPPEGKIGVEMNADGKSGTLYAARSSGYADVLLPE